MTRLRVLMPLIGFFIFFTTLACGKKTSPFLPMQDFSAKVVALKSEQREDGLFLTGVIQEREDPGRIGGLVKGCRLLYGLYPVAEPPCAGCPIEYHGFYEFQRSSIYWIFENQNNYYYVFCICFIFN